VFYIETGRAGFDSRQGQRFFSRHCVLPASRDQQLPIQWVPETTQIQTRGTNAFKRYIYIYIWYEGWNGSPAPHNSRMSRDTKSHCNRFNKSFSKHNCEQKNWFVINAVDVCSKQAGRQTAAERDRPYVHRWTLMGGGGGWGGGPYKLKRPTGPTSTKANLDGEIIQLNPSKHCWRPRQTLEWPTRYTRAHLPPSLLANV
jgi:hypothetical protein